MTIDLLKTQITALPDAEIRPLLEWLHDYYGGPVWDRQIESDVERLGSDALLLRRAGEESLGSRF